MELTRKLQGLFPTEPDHIRFAINFFTVIQLGALTLGLREALRLAPKKILKESQQKLKNQMVKMLIVVVVAAAPLATAPLAAVPLAVAVAPQAVGRVVKMKRSDTPCSTLSTNIYVSYLAIFISNISLCNIHYVNDFN